MNELGERELQLLKTGPNSLKPLKRKSVSSRKKSPVRTPKPAVLEIPEYEFKELVTEDQEVVFKPNSGPQTEFLASSEQEVLYGGAAGGGKSFAILADALRDISNPNFRGLILRRTTEELRELIQKSQELYPKAIPELKWSERKMEWRHPKGGTLWMSFLERDQDVYRYQGQAFTYIAFDELTQWASPFAWNYMRSRLRSADPSLSLYMRATTNPGGAGHAWVKKMFIDPSPWGKSFWATDIETGETLVYPKGHSKAGQKLFKRRFIPAKLSDNPYLYDSGSYEANLLSLPEAERNRLLYGDWDVVEGSAFPEFNRKIHVVEPYDIPYEWRRFRSCDFGYSSASGVLWFAVTPDEQLIVYRELYTSRVHAFDLGMMIKEEEGRERISYGVLDSSCWHQRGNRGPSIAEEMMDSGTRWIPSDRTRGARVSGKNQIHKRLQIDPYTNEPGLIIFSNCVNLISQLPVIPLDKNNLEDVDTKSEDHLYDALRYGCMSRPRSSFWDVDPQTTRSYTPIDPVFGY